MSVFSSKEILRRYLTSHVSSQMRVENLKNKNCNLIGFGNCRYAFKNFTVICRGFHKITTKNLWFHIRRIFILWKTPAQPQLLPSRMWGETSPTPSNQDEKKILLQYKRKFILSLTEHRQKNATNTTTSHNHWQFLLGTKHFYFTNKHNAKSKFI